MVTDGFDVNTAAIIQICLLMTEVDVSLVLVLYPYTSTMDHKCNQLIVFILAMESERNRQTD